MDGARDAVLWELRGHEFPGDKLGSTERSDSGGTEGFKGPNKALIPGSAETGKHKDRAAGPGMRCSFKVLAEWTPSLPHGPQIKRSSHP